MPVPPSSMKITCRRCGRSELFSPQSDVLMLEEFRLDCRWCGHRPLVVSMPSRSSVWLARLARRLNKYR